MVYPSLRLFEKSEWEIGTTKAKPEFRKLREESKPRVERGAEIMKRLERAGWKRDGNFMMYFQQEYKVRGG